MSGSTSHYTPTHEIIAIHAKLGATFASKLTLPLEFREHQLLQLARLLKDNQEIFAKALWDDLGRPPIESYQAEIGPLVQRAVSSATKLRTWAAPEDKSQRVHDFQKSWNAKVFKQPKGVALVIAPWNYPCILSFQPLIGAIAAGCCCVVKPSEIAPAVSKAIRELVPKYLDSRAYAVVEGGIAETTKLLELKWDHIFYTGNGRVARIISEAAAKHLTPMTLELGGKCPVIIDPNYSDLDLAARRILWGKYNNSGQICVAPDYCILPSKALLEPFIAGLKKAYATFFPDGHDPLTSPHYSHIVSQLHFSRLSSLLAETKGTIQFGGQSDKSSLKMALTGVVLDSTVIGLDAVRNDSLMRGEIFGPILPVVVLEGGIEAAAQFVSTGDHPLVLYAFSEDPPVKDRIRTLTMSGNLVFNDTFIQLSGEALFGDRVLVLRVFKVDELPFGGVGESGHGRQILRYSFDAFSYERASIDMPLTAEQMLSNRYPPYTPEAEKFFRATADVPIPASDPEKGLLSGV